MTRLSLAPLSWLCALLTITTAGTAQEQPGHEQELLSNTRQLIFEGRRSGEGYFSDDGTQMIFQSERQPDNPFYQIYLMDLETGDTRRVSPGVGKTTCAWIHPNGETLLFASTHEDPHARQKQQAELDKRAQGQGSRYSWSFDEHYDIYEANAQGTILRKLTDAPGYDAEGSWSPDGKHIVFASNRHAYQETLTPEQRQILATDPSYFMDLYLMDANGDNLRRLTEVPGYDGGPFFSPDGRKIVWRRFAESGHTAEIWTMNADGTGQRPITHLGVMSWAPYFHPSGDYVIFANNAHGYGNFELYLVDTAGRAKPVRVTATEGFDGLPVFTPDGRRLAWASGRSADGKAQIHIADWNDVRARQLLGLTDASRITDAPEAQTALPGIQRTAPEISPEDLRLHVNYLASQPLAGRLTGTEGTRLATRYVADAMQALGLQPAGDMGGWFQNYAFTSSVMLAENNRLTLLKDGTQIPLVLQRDWRPLAFSGSGEVSAAPVVFAGYGIVAPGEGEFAAYDAYQGLDVKDKWVLALRFMPEDISPEHRQYLHAYAGLRFKAMLARDQGARGLLLVSGPRAQVRDQLVPLRSEAGAGGGSLPVVSLSDAAAQTLLDAVGKDLGQLQASLDQGQPGAGFAITGVELAADIRLKSERGQDRNVLGRLNAGETPGDALVVIGAHLDHIGSGEDMDSRASGGETGQPHLGADDNASGVAALLEVAQYLSHLKASGELELAQDILFAAWTGEEMGRLGSGHFVKSFSAPGKGKGLTPTVFAYLNMDMVGRLDRRLYLQATGSSSVWAGEIERSNAALGLPLRLQEDSYLPTDTTSFYLVGVPVLNAFTGAHADYNTPRDTADRINYEGLARIARLMALLTRSLAMRTEAPDYLAMQKPVSKASRANLRAYFGTIPDYTETDLAGVVLTGVAKDGPAEKGGLLAGDIIVEVAGRKIENIYDYTFALNALKVGQAVKVDVLRGGEKKELEVTPESRE